MQRWFLSYNSQDLALMQGFEAALRRKDSDAKIFFAPASLRAGGFWLPELAKGIAEATAFLLLVGEKGVGPWQVIEYYEALDRRVKHNDFPIVLVLLDGQPAPGLPFLRQLHWIVTPDPASEKEIARIFDAATGRGGRPAELWRYTSPYRGLEAMEEKDSDYFFGRNRETMEALEAVQAQGRLPILIGNSGVGKSSLAQAGILAALKRQGWPDKTRAWPAVFKNCRQWSFLTLRPGGEPLKALVDCFLDAWQFDATDPKRVERQRGWVEALQGQATLSDLIDATERRRHELDQAKPPAYFLYIDQSEELYARAEERERRRFSELLAGALSDTRLRAMMSMRSDFFGSLQTDAALFKARQLIEVPPLGEDELREVVSRPAQLLGARFESDGVVDIIVRRAAEDSVKDVGALPLLSYTLDDMWTQMLKAEDGVLRMPAQSFELGGVLVERANRFLAERPGTENILKRILTLKLATVREDGEPTRRRALRAEFPDEEWRLVSELCGYPNRLLVTATTAAGETYAEVAHEAIFRRWKKLRDWIAAEREFLAWRTGLEAARRAFQATPDATKAGALLMGLPLEQARNWLSKRAEDIPQADRKFILQSRKTAQQRSLRVQTTVGVLAFSLIAALIGWLNQSYLQERINWLMTMRPYKVANFDTHSLTSESERALKPLASFHECVKDCPEMMVIPTGSIMMGSLPGEKGRYNNEGPQHLITITRPFAVSRFDVTFDEWDACVKVGGCPQGQRDSGFGRGKRPVININWYDAQQYATWLSKMTGQTYRLLTEAEWEYAARAGSTTAYFWGDEVGDRNANCNGCGSQWDNRATSPVGSFNPNSFGLYDMVGNVSQWVEDCWHINYDGAPNDGSAWTTGDCNNGIVRGGSWFKNPPNLRSADRFRNPRTLRNLDFGIRLGRTLLP
jgi:formylglycine-generating enzyme required for sulfatase activity